MPFSPHTTASGYILPSIHSAPPFYTQQSTAQLQAPFTDNWIKIILGYARHRRLFTLRIEDAEVPGGDWDEVLRNPRINRRVQPQYLAYILSELVKRKQAVYDPPRQTRSVILYWRLPEEWAEVLHEWATNSGQLNTILTYQEITEPPVPSPLSNVPLQVLRQAIGILSKNGRAQTISVADGEGVRFFTGQI
ncbi:winged helix DNA-binding domain-containing protein [Punctularia strigosozonata HHB-11173 SS5]|uniref:Winged helix DNA-binding domain-containing protein n=1 Tax=Punctularia strigosozonata (strain HHB-11173) TaxID=741275 RepID=R7S231_PUNST|nr:winged helix DNA-binding domain-containing protein [Punctularia strigosozonata HHB-11173 SS5]EIN03837.1 winged helix DNA-binding domain-containing protein [Punctularia strigosozonata HHB-11173 SS5]